MPRRLSESTKVEEHFTNREDGLILRVTYKDTEGGGGCFVLTSAEVTMLCADKTNQAALGGGSHFTTGPITIKVDPQTGQIVEAGGAAIGDIIGAAIKTAVKP